MVSRLRSWFVRHCPFIRQLHSVARDCETSRAVDNWVAANTIPISCSETGRALVRERIVAYFEFLKCHPFIPVDVDYLAMWCAHLKPTSYVPEP